MVNDRKGKVGTPLKKKIEYEVFTEESGLPGFNWPLSEEAIKEIEEIEKYLYR